MALYVWPPESVSVSVPPLEILVDGVPTAVDYDTGTPSASTPVPVYVVGSVLSSSAVDYGASNVAQRTAAQIGNSTGQADFNAGNASAQTLRTVIATNQSAIPVTGPITNTELRATPVPVSGPLTDTQLRASAVPVSASSLPLPAGAATESTLAAMSAKFPSVLGQNTAANSLAVVLASDQGNSTAANQLAEQTLIGAVNETAPATDTASSGLNGRLQRIAQRLTSLIALLPASLGQKTMANSLAVVISSDQLSIPVASSSSTAAGTITNSQVTVGTTAVRATVSGSAPSATRKKLMIKPSISNSGRIFLGSSSVTTSNGLEIVGPDRLDFDFDSGDYYLISDTAAQVVEVLEKV